MQNKGFLDFIEKLQAAASGKKSESSTNESASSASATGGNSGANASANSGSSGNGGDNRGNRANENSAEQKESGAKTAINLLAPANEKSYIKTYNPFGEALSPRPQITAPKAKKQPKEKIDLSLGKNLAGEKKSEVSKNMLDLIKRHNALSREIKRGDTTPSDKNAAEIKKR